MYEQINPEFVTPPSSVVKCLWAVFVWRFGVLCLPFVCGGSGCFSLSVCVCVCVCVWPVDIFTRGQPYLTRGGLLCVTTCDFCFMAGGDCIHEGQPWVSPRSALYNPRPASICIIAACLASSLPRETTATGSPEQAAARRQLVIYAPRECDSLCTSVTSCISIRRSTTTRPPSRLPHRVHQPTRHRSGGYTVQSDS